MIAELLSAREWQELTAWKEMKCSGSEQHWATQTQNQHEIEEWIIINGFLYKFLNGSKSIYFSEACRSSCRSLFTSQTCRGLESSFSLVHFQKKITSFGTGLTLGIEHVSPYFVQKNYCVTRGNLSAMSKDRKNRRVFPLICLLTLSCSRGKWCA